MVFQSIGEIIKEMSSAITGDSICGCERAYGDRGDSVLERQFWHMMRKTELGWHGAADQLQIGKYRVDAIMDCDGESVVVELDGKRFHNVNADTVRDHEILKEVDAVIRIPFYAMWHFEYAVFKVLGEWYPRFNIPGNPVSLASEEDLRNEWEKIDSSFDDHADRESWMEEINGWVQAWNVDGAVGYVGTPRQLLDTLPKGVIKLERGRAVTGMVGRIYQKANCDSMKRSTRRSTT